MEKYILKRTGNAPLQFTGELLAQNEGKWVNGKDQNRWHDLYLYRTESDQYVIHVVYHTIWQVELDHWWAEVASSPEEAVETLGFYEPIAVVQGFPNRPGYTERQANLLKWIKDRFDYQVGEILGEVEDLFEVI